MQKNGPSSSVSHGIYNSLSWKYFLWNWNYSLCGWRWLSTKLSFWQQPGDHHLLLHSQLSQSVLSLKETWCPEHSAQLPPTSKISCAGSLPLNGSEHSWVPGTARREYTPREVMAVGRKRGRVNLNIIALSTYRRSIAFDLNALVSKRSVLQLLHISSFLWHLAR